MKDASDAEQQIREISKRQDVDLGVARDMWKVNEKLGFQKYHDGGIVGGKTSKLGEMFNKAFNLGDHETFTKSLKGELQIPPKNFPNILEAMKNTISQFQPALAGNVYHQYDLDLNIDNFSGTRKEADSSSKRIMDNLKKMGKK